MISPGPGPSAGPAASPVARMRSAASLSRWSAGGIAAGSGSGARRGPAGRGPTAGRGGRLEGKPEQAGSVADQVQPPGAARRHGRKLDDAPPGSRLPLAGLEPCRVAGPLVVHRPEPVVRQVLRSGPGDLQVRARTFRGPVHAHDHGDQGFGPGHHQGHEVHRGRRAVAGHAERQPDGRDPHVRVGRARRRLDDSGREYGAGQHALAAIPVQQEPRPDLDGVEKMTRRAEEGFLVEHAGREKDPARPADLPLRALRGDEQRRVRRGPDIGPGRGVEEAKPGAHPPQFGLGQHPQVGLGPLVAHPPSLHPAARKLPRAARGPQSNFLASVSSEMR